MIAMTTLKIKTQKGGHDLTLDDSLLLGGGTEGVIYQVPGDDSLVIKIYRDRVADEHARKLRVMVANPPDDPMQHKGHASIAWPTDLVVWRQNQEVCGFVMPRLRDAHPISRFYDLGLRRIHLPLFTYQSLCLLGSNLASAVWALHERGYVIGDVNEGNIIADNQALVTIVDTDSFQIREEGSGIVYRCTVHTPFYTPPEFQDVSFDQVSRSPEQDHFGIGVLLFQLLMEGQLPFACAFSNTSNAVDALECLKRGYFPYAQSPNGISPPGGAPPYGILHPALQKLFNQCFVDGYKYPALRPTAKDWHRTLRDIGRELVKCTLNGQHYYFNHLQNCPWCDRARLFKAAKKRGNWDPFPQPGTVSVPTSSPGGRAGTQRPISAPSVRPSVPRPTPQSPIVFTASATSIAPGQSITFQWTVPNAHSVQLKERSGRIVATSNSPSGSATVWLTKSITYQLTAAGVNVVMPAPIAISVTQPTPVALKEIVVELNAPIALHSAQLALRRTLRLKQALTPLISPMRLKEHMQLDGYQDLSDVTVELNYAAPAG
jgi:serine/threonine protein kinase